jgi:hypothetical protein
MRRLICSFAVLLVCGLAGTQAPAATLADFNSAVEDVASHYRVALGYLRTGNNDLAMLEVDRLRDSWISLADKYGKDRPPEFEASLYVRTLTDVSARVAAADTAARRGDLKQMDVALAGIRAALSELRRKSGTEVLADCVLDSSAAMTRLGGYDRPSLDLRDAGERAGVIAAGRHYRDTLQRCDRMAPPPVKASPEFRRLLDGAIASLALLPDGVAKGDTDLLHRIVIELRSLDNLLAFRFG